MDSEADLGPLPFGIPQLDHLLGYQSFGPDQFRAPLRTATSLAIVGKDGTGKSVFALHLASMYHAVHYLRAQTPAVGVPPLVFYVSSDFRYGAALKVWHNFTLDYPWQRFAPFASLEEIKYRRAKLNDQTPYLKVNLGHCLPSEPPGRNTNGSTWVTQHIATQDEASSVESVAFLDLASTTTGDDWLFLARLLASVPKHSPEASPNLLIVDSIAGFETLVGDRNSFGENMTRRAKIAQLIRVAAPNWHTVFLVEEPDEGKHHPEEYVTDTVIHLVRQGKSGQIRRVLEIEKCRARAFGRGEHPFEIRDGLGSSTGGWENPDDPMALIHPTARRKMTPARAHHAYIQVFPSLHYLSGNFSRGSHLTRPAPETAGQVPFAVPFGVPYLDSSLARGRQIAAGIDAHGLPPGKVTSLIGDEGTLKGALAERFLLEGFRYVTEVFEHVHSAVGEWMKTPHETRSDLWTALKGSASGFPRRYGHSVPEFVCQRIASSPGAWLDDTQFKGQRDAVIEVAGSDKVRLLTQAQLERKAERVRRPLSGRRDVFDFYTVHGRDRYLENVGVTSPERIQAYSQFVTTLSVLRASAGFLTPVVFLSTHDSSAERLADHVLDNNWDGFKKHLTTLLGETPSGRLVDDVRHGLLRVLERFIIVRRLELVDASSQQLWQISRECVTHALHLVGNLPTLEAAPPKHHAGEVRVVISDLRLLRDTYPEVADDPLFLPMIVFRLRRLGVTTLLLDSDLGRPDQNATHAMNGALRSLVDHQVYTWKVPFFGEQRVAISVLPPILPGQPSAIRELKLDFRETRDGKRLRSVDVDPHFELYSGLEVGNPSAVPLEVIFYGETQAFDEYVAEERAVFERLFSPIDGGQSIIEVRKAADYHSLRDYCHLPADTKLPHTLVFMIDGYWALARSGALRSQTDYLQQRLDGRFTDGRKDYMDVFGLFRKTRRHLEKAPAAVRGESSPSGVSVEPEFNSRGDFFTNAPYFKGVTGDVNRVPFMWDFGFLLCHEEPWLRALDVPLPTRPLASVKGVWERLTRITVADDAVAGLEVRRGDNTIGWRDFFEACGLVAGAERIRTGRDIAAFDFFTGGVDSLTSLFMEVWFSEIYQDAVRMGRIGADAENGLGERERMSVQKWSGDALESLSGFTSAKAPDPLVYLQDLLRPFDENAPATRLADLFGGIAKAATGNPAGLPAEPTGAQDSGDIPWARLQIQIRGFSLQWYKAWLLLVEVLDLRRYFSPTGSFDFKPRDTAFEAVASRHWYRTACEAAHRVARDDEHITRVPVRFPGHFSVRSGWYLAVASASRSYRLADRAMDILSSRRANRSRLHRGLGLPTRDIPGMDGSGLDQGTRPIDRVLTGLIVARTDAVHRVSYQALLQLGGGTTTDQRADFRWLLRSRFRDFDRQARVVRRWMNRVFAWSVQYRYQARSNWRSSYVAYDEINTGDLSKIHKYTSFNSHIPRFLDGFIDELNVAIDGSE